MANFTMERHQSLPAVIVSYTPEFSAHDEIVANVEAITQILDQQTAPVFLISDASSVKNISIQDLIEAINFIARGGNTLMDHPMLDLVIVVTTGEVVKMSVEGMKSPLFGSRRVRVASTLEEALAVVAEESVHTD